MAPGYPSHVCSDTLVLGRPNVVPRLGPVANDDHDPRETISCHARCNRLLTVYDLIFLSLFKSIHYSIKCSSSSMFQAPLQLDEAAIAVDGFDEQDRFPARRRRGNLRLHRPEHLVGDGGLRLGRTRR